MSEIDQYAKRIDGQWFVRKVYPRGYGRWEKTSADHAKVVIPHCTIETKRVKLPQD